MKKAELTMIDAEITSKQSILEALRKEVQRLEAQRQSLLPPESPQSSESTPPSSDGQPQNEEVKQ